MAVYTALSEAELATLLAGYRIGAATACRGVLSGIENSNFFLDTAAGSYVLTVFERLQAGELPFYLGLMRHLARDGLAVPQPEATVGGSLWSQARGKPVAIVSRLPGRAVERPGPVHCAAIGRFLARMHLDAASYAPRQPDPRGPSWWPLAQAQLGARLDPGQRRLLDDELGHQDRWRAGASAALLPAGPIHADLFRDNALFAGEALGGVIDFYFAGCGPWLYDLAVCANDWCIEGESCALDPLRVRAMLAAYHDVRPLLPAEHAAWRVQLRAAALRFWLSRLLDHHQPRPATLLVAHDPERFERTLRLRVSAAELPWI